MNGALLVATVGAVGVLHTLVPDHWAPIVVIGRRRGWSPARTAGAASIAGTGHVLSTLVLGGIVWIAGAGVAARYGHAVAIVSALALLAFGLWIAYGGWKEARAAQTSDPDVPIDASHGGRTAFLLIVGSSPMMEGVPAFLAASTGGVALLGTMAAVFAAATIATYVVTCVAGVAGLQRMSLGPFERYGELLSGSLVALVGVFSLVTIR